MSVLVRFATPNDVTAIFGLITELAVFEKLPSEVEINEATLIEDGFGANPKFKTFIAEEKGIIIGMALFYERYSTWKGKAIHLEDLIVTQEKRGMGTGRALYNAIMQYAFDNGYKRVAWDVLDWNINAIEFYEYTGAEVLKDWRVVHMNAHNLEKYIDENI